MADAAPSAATSLDGMAVRITVAAVNRDTLGGGVLLVL